MGRAFDHGLYVFPRGYLAGLTLSTAGASTTFSVAAGEAVDSTQAALLTLTASINKTTSAWAVGSGNGALDTGAIAASTWYHVYLIKRLDTNVTDVLVSLSASAPTMPANYTVSRRIGAMKTNGSSQWIKFQQFGSLFLWDTAVTDVSADTTIGTATKTYTISVPTGISVRARISTVNTNSAAATVAYVWSPLLGGVDSGVTGGFVSQNNVSTNYGTASLEIITNTSGQISASTNSASNNTVWVVTHGWVDYTLREG